MLKKLWDNFEETVLVYSYLLIIPLLTAQVIFRYVLNNSLTWSEELVRFIFIWQVWLGAALCVKEKRHIRIDVFTDKLPKGAYKVFEMIITLISIAFCCFMVYKGASVVKMIMGFKQQSPALHVPMQLVYLSVPFSSALMIIHYVEYLVKLLKGKEE